ncbi:hypothetical protein I6I87_10345 [Moraxella osloensis]|nr:hypothetical protein [Moraxella osloensis]QQU06443.1 hypothetical protein I6I87_10345 [Moraxella osloensis]
MKVQFLNSNSIELLIKKLIVVNALLICLLEQNAFAGTMYVFKDKEGQVLLTNVITEDKKPVGNNFKDFDKMVSVNYEDEHRQSKNRDSYQEFLQTLKFIGIIQNDIKIYQGITPRGNAIYFDGSKQFGQLTGFVVDEIIKNKKVKYSWTNLNSSINGNFKFFIYNVDCKKGRVLTNKNELRNISNMSALHQVTANQACRILSKK